jgi:hypothetical protein
MKTELRESEIEACGVIGSFWSGILNIALQSASKGVLGSIHLLNLLVKVLIDN